FADTDSIKKNIPVKPKEDNPLKSKVTYSADDSIHFDVANQHVFLYGNAEVTYEDVNLKAAYIELNLADNTVYACGKRDSLGKSYGLPDFKQGTESFKAQSIRYNFKTKKGKISEVSTKEGEGYIHGETIKKDSNNTIYIKNGRYTTCDLAHPDFYIQASRIKIIPNKMIVTGPAYLVIEDVPTPLAIPFGFFPNAKGRSSGIIIPTYGASDNLGYYLRDGGYYFGINDYVDAALRGDIYSRESWALHASSDYKKRYEYNGFFDFSYSKMLLGVPETPSYNKENDFFVRWSHTQDPKANPSSYFSASINAGSSKYNTYNATDATDYLSTTFQSSVTYTKSWQNTPFNLSANASHNQNTITHQLTVSLPQITFSMNRIYPFKSQSDIVQKWYDKISLSYLANASNSINTYDSLFFRPATLRQMQNGMRQVIPISTNFNLFKYITFTPTINASSAWYFQTIREQYNSKLNSVVTDTVQGFRSANNASFSAQFNTRIYGNYMFQNMKLEQIRHVMIPTFGFTYQPGFGGQKFGNYSVQKDSLGDIQNYSIFQNGIYGSLPANASGLVTWSLDNNLEMKVREKNDTATIHKKITLIETFQISSAYDVIGKTWQNITISGRTKVFKKLDVTFNGVIDPYRVDAQGNQLDELQFQHGEGLGRLTNATLSLSTSFRSTDITKKTASVTTPQNQQQMNKINAYADEYVDFDIPWSLNAYFNLLYNNYQVPPLVQPQITQSLSFSGDLELTKNWRIGFSSGYDFESSQLTYTSLNAYRDLHCWAMEFSWIPFGFRQSYSISIHVKSSVLQDLRLTRRRDWYDY
ncbi:MAG: putative LPS assembly protein LptD, partial [Bacteroidia bacterium]